VNILGISAFYHDSAACLVRDGIIAAAAQEERFTRRKHDADFPAHAVRFCVQEQGLSPEDLDYVVFYDKPFLTFERLLETYLTYAPRGFRSFLTSMPVWIKQKLWTRELIKERLNYTGTVLFAEHHESHAAAAFYPSPFQEAAILTLDGVGEWATASFGVGRDNCVTLDSELHFPHSLGLLYSAFTYYAGFKVNAGEYKLMGLAPYGRPIFRDLILKELVDLKEDGSFHMNMAYFNYCAGLTMTNRRFDELFGAPPRRRETPLTGHYMDVAASVQAVTEEIMLRCVRHVHRKTGQKNLCLAGGVALNCVANGRVLREGPFERIWIQPAAGDAGSALGAALLVWHRYCGSPRHADGARDSQQASRLGPSYDDAAINSFLRERGISHSALDDEELSAWVAGLIADGKVIGWFQGRMEFGPRALGSRSIIGDARSSVMQELMNRKIKFRESFRPFAPSVLQEDAGRYFDLSTESPYMLLVAPVAKGVRRPLTTDEAARSGMELLKTARSEIPAVTHVDYSARVQTVAREEDPLYYDLLAAFKKQTGCGVIINTSFNVRGEPIVCTPEDAFRCFMRTHMDALVLGRCLLLKEEQLPVDGDASWQEEFELD